MKEREKKTPKTNEKLCFKENKGHLYLKSENLL